MLDEAHKYLTNNDSARLNSSIASIIRQQRHLATRVVIATQEPTVVPPTVLDLASYIICHRFSSPSWCTHLSRHVSAGSDVDWFTQVMELRTGDALVFSPTSLTVRGDESAGDAQPVLVGRQALRVRVRPRLTRDGGASLLATENADMDVTTPFTPPHSSPVPYPIEPPASSVSLPTSSACLPANPPSLTNFLPSPYYPSSLPKVPVSAANGPAPFSFTAVSGTQAVLPRYQPLLDVLRSRHGRGVRVRYNTVAGCNEFASVRGGKGWFAALAEEARQAGAVTIGGASGNMWVRLV